ncbi:MAG: argininosuccinate synthase [Nitrososphaerota archaeon]|nr:argininosuccinate synthase [Nitrososphaerota archaeon]
MKEKIVLAYSGGLDTSVCVKWLQEKYDAEVITLTLDLGQREEFSEIAARSKATGAVKHFQLDAKEEYVTNYVMPSVAANGMYQGKYPLATALGRPLIATKMVEVAEAEGATAVAHGCTGKGNDQVRMDVTVRAMDPSLRVIAPVREWNMSRDQELVYAKEHGIKIKPSNSVFSIDQNLWGRSIESGPLEDPDFEPPVAAFEWVTQPRDAPDTPGYLELGFAEGVPKTLDGEELGEIELIKRVNQFAGKHGVGIIDHVEDRLVGIKSREVYEAPAALTIIEAHRDLEQLVLTRHELAFKNGVEREWSWLVYSGLWMEPLRFALDSFIRTTQRRVSGNVRVKLYKGGLRVVGRTSKNSLYRPKLSTYQKDSTFDQASAVGFIELWGLQSRIAAKVASEITRGKNVEHPKRKQSQALKQKSK